MKLKCKKCGSDIRLNVTSKTFGDKNMITFKCPGCGHKMSIKKRSSPKPKIDPTATFIGVVKNIDVLSLHELKTGQKFALDQPFLAFGRAASNSDADLQLRTNDPSLSRKHCVFRKTNRGVTIEDTSLNGILHNGNVINKDSDIIYLKKGDVLNMGDHKFNIV